MVSVPLCLRESIPFSRSEESHAEAQRRGVQAVRTRFSIPKPNDNPSAIENGLASLHGIEHVLCVSAPLREDYIPPLKRISHRGTEARSSGGPHAFLNAFQNDHRSEFDIVFHSCTDTNMSSVPLCLRERITFRR